MSSMTSRERLLTALNNEKPDRLPCQVHGWMPYYLKTYLNGADWFEAYARFGMDYAIYASPDYEYAEKDLARYETEQQDLGCDAQGNQCSVILHKTPEGELREVVASNAVTSWHTEYLIKSECDFELWDRYAPVPIRVDFTKMHALRDRLGDKGILRTFTFSPGQGSPWQSFCTMYGTETAIMLAMEDPEQLHHYLDRILQKTLQVTQLSEGTPADMVETDGGAGSNSVISPAMFREYCLPYDKKQNALLHEMGLKVVCHLCGGVMQQLELVVETDADGLETMTPPSMGGDCDIAEASRRVGDALFFIGGFDQNAGFERGTPEEARRQVYALFEATREQGGYICCPSDHFFSGDPANVQAFADACRDCAY